ncbi:MAG: metallophosphoesterase family protein [Thermoleophilaceae bacterium]
MLIAIVSDTHMPRGERQLPGACVERMAAADLILHVGDVMTATTLAELELIGPPLLAVQGNVDDAQLRRRLPVERVVDAEGARIGMVHDSGARLGRLERMRLRFPDSDAVLFGHSHMPLHEEEGGFQIFNPGSPTQRRRAPAHSMGWARVDDGRVTFELVELGAPGRRIARPS